MIPIANPSQFGGDPANSFTVVGLLYPATACLFARSAAFCGVRNSRYFRQPHDRCTDTSALGVGWRLGFIYHVATCVFVSRCTHHIRLNMMPLRRDPKMVADPTFEERKYLEQLGAWLKDETGYQWIQGTRPQTLAFALT